MGLLGAIFGSSSKSASSSNSNTTNTTDNRQVGGDGAIMVGAGGVYQGTDGGAVRIAEFNRQLMGEMLTSQTDAVKSITNMGGSVLNNLGDSVTNVLNRSGANMSEAWSHTLDSSEQIIGKLTAGAQANADASQVVALAALKSNQNDGGTLSEIVKYAAIAIGVVGIAWAWKK
jgi:hypothetical protein